MKSNKKLAQVAIVHALTEFVSAKHIVQAHILGYKVVMRKKDVKLGDSVILIRPGAICPKAKWSEFLGNDLKVRFHRFKKIDSDALALPIKLLLPNVNRRDLKLGQDVTKEVGVYEKPAPKGCRPPRVARSKSSGPVYWNDWS